MAKWLQTRGNPPSHPVPPDQPTRLKGKVQLRRKTTSPIPRNAIVAPRVPRVSPATARAQDPAHDSGPAWRREVRSSARLVDRGLPRSQCGRVSCASQTRTTYCRRWEWQRALCLGMHEIHQHERGIQGRYGCCGNGTLPTPTEGSRL